MELYDEKYVKNYIMNKKIESYHYLEKKKADYASYYIWHDFNIHRLKICFQEFNEYNSKWRKVHLFSFLLLEEQIQEHSEICNYYLEELVTYIKKNSRKNAVHHILSYLISKNFEQSDVYTDELVMTYLKTVQKRKYSRKTFNKIYPLLSLYIHEKKLENHLTLLEKLEGQKGLLREDVKKLADKLKSYKTLKEEVAVSQSEKGEDGKINMGKVPRNKHNGKNGVKTKEEDKPMNQDIKTDVTVSQSEKGEDGKINMKKVPRNKYNGKKSVKTNEEDKPMNQDIKTDTTVSQSEKGEDGKINMKKVPRNKYNGKNGVKTKEEDELNNGTKEMTILDDSKEQVNQRIKEILEALDYSDKQGLKMKLEELKKWTMELRELQLFYNQLNELISLGNYEDDDNQKKLLKFIDTYLKK